MPDLVEIPPPSADLQALITQQNDIPAPAIEALKSNPTPEMIKQFDDQYGEGSHVARIMLGIYQ